MTPDACYPSPCDAGHLHPSPSRPDGHAEGGPGGRRGCRGRFYCRRPGPCGHFPKAPARGGPCVRPFGPGGVRDRAPLTEQERAAEDSRVEKELHARALDRKITLGREVDDGILESLTSVAATLESKRVMIYTDPHGYEQLVGQGVASLNRAIRNLRACIVGPESKVVRTAEFAGALERRLADLKAGARGPVRPADRRGRGRCPGRRAPRWAAGDRPRGRRQRASPREVEDRVPQASQGRQFGDVPRPGQRPGLLPGTPGGPGNGFGAHARRRGGHRRKARCGDADRQRHPGHDDGADSEAGPGRGRPLMDLVDLHKRDAGVPARP